MVNPFEKFLTSGRFALWQKKQDRAVGVDIGSASIKVVQLRNDKGQVILETYGEIATGPYRSLSVGQAALLTADSLSEALKDIFREANVTTNRVGMSLPLRSSLLVIIDIPRVGKEMLSRVVPIEARKYIPVPISEVAFDWWLIPEKEMGDGEKEPDHLSVLVVAVHNKAIHEYREICQAAGLEPGFFEIETFSALRSVLAGEMSSTAILDLGASSTKMAIVDYGVVRLSHTIDKGAQDITLGLARALGVDFAKAEEIKRQVGLVERFIDGREISPIVNGLMEYVFAEANKIIAGYQSKSRRAVNKLILIGGGALLRGLPEFARRNFAMTVEVGRPFAKVETPEFLTAVLDEAGAGFAIALGAALRHLQSFE